MTHSLEDKLRQILKAEVVDPILEGEGVDAKSYFGIDSDDIIARFTEAFESDGWLSPEEKEKVQQLLNQMADTAHMAFRMPTIQPVALKKKQQTAQNLMTGREWLKRFEQELKGYLIPCHDVRDQEEKLAIFNDVKAAARRAAEAEE